MHLRQRKCVEVPSTGTETGEPAFEWVCDFWYPKISEMIVRMYDIAEGGRVTDQAGAWFYTNLREPTSAERGNPDDPGNAKAVYQVHAEWIMHWLLGNGITEHCSAFNSLDKRWKSQQLGFIEANEEYMENFSEDELKRIGGGVNIFKNCHLQALARAVKYPDANLFTTKGVL